MLDLNGKPITKVMFLDIETTSIVEKFSELDERMQQNFLKRFRNSGAEEILSGIGKNGKKLTEAKVDELKEALWSEKAPLFAEFGRILCISLGVLLEDRQNDGFVIRTTTYSNEDEKVLLNNFLTSSSKIKSSLENPKNPDNYIFASHNGLVFDFPFLAKRIIINGMDLPTALDYGEKKPWEVTWFADTKNSWKFGVFDGSTSLDTLASVFNIPTSKDDMDGSEVKNVYWVEKDLPRIVKYCEKDVVALARVFLAMKNIKKEVRVPELIPQPQSETQQ